MDRKQELTSVDLAALVTELGAYEGAKVDKAYLYGEDFLRLKLRDFDRGRVELVVEIGDVKRAHVAAPERVPDAPGRPPNFAMMLRNRLSGADFAGVEQYEFDRILEFHFEREDEDTIIVAELFGHGNVAVADPNYEVIDCLDTVRLKSRTVAPGARYEFPESRINPLTMDYEAFAAIMDESDTDVVRTLATQLNFGGLYAEELCTRAGVEKALSIDQAADAQYEPLYDAIQELAVDLRTGALDPRIYYAEVGEDGGDGNDDRGENAGGSDGERTRIDVTPFPLEEYDHLESEAFDAFNDAVDEYFHHLDLTEEAEASERQRPDFEAEIEKQKRIIEQQERAIEDFEADAQAEREKAELVYANYGLVDEILSTIREARANDVPWDEIEATFEKGAERGISEAEAVRNMDPNEGLVTVEIEGTTVTLDAAEGVEHNADRLYKEAKRIEEKKEGAEAAVEDTREALEEVKQRREEWEARQEAGGAGDDDGDGDEEEGAEDRDWLNEPSIPVRKSEQWFERFRWFHTSDGFLVIGGRDADQNEELVKKYLEKGDLFFHAQAHGGPATILKATDPSEAARDVDVPETSIEEAAQFAVSYSSVWKDGRYSGDVYHVDHDQVTKTPESGEFLEKGGFAIRGERTYHRDVGIGAAVGITCEPSTRVIGGPPSAVREHAETWIEVEPGRYAQGDVAKRIYRRFRERFTDTSFVRKVASPDLIQHFLPPGGSRIAEE